MSVSRQHEIPRLGYSISESGKELKTPYAPGMVNAFKMDGLQSEKGKGF